MIILPERASKGTSQLCNIINHYKGVYIMLPGVHVSQYPQVFFGFLCFIVLV